MEKLIIIGAVAAGSKAAAKAKRLNPNLDITIYTEDTNIAYSACGMPYYIGGEFEDYHRLIEYSTKNFEQDFNLKIFTRHRVTKIIPEKNTIQITKLEDNSVFEEKYDKLLIATGASAKKIHAKGSELPQVVTLRHLSDCLRIKQFTKTTKRAVIIGGGSTGLEMFEAFWRLGIDTKMVDWKTHLTTKLDEDIGTFLKELVETHYPNSIILNDSAKSFVSDAMGRLTAVELISGKVLPCDLALISIGVKPNVKIAKEAGIEIGSSGAIKVNEKMRTNIPNIYAAGDCVEKKGFVTNRVIWHPQGSTANKEGRTAAMNIAGIESSFKGVLESAITKFFDIKIGATGINCKLAKELGYEPEFVIIKSKDRAGYMQDAKDITIKLIADRKSGRIIGGQGIGLGDIDKRINIIANAISAQNTPEELSNSDLPYAPPFSMAIDTVLVAAYELDKKLKK